MKKEPKARRISKAEPTVAPRPGSTSQKLTLEHSKELEAHLWATADFLRGKIDRSDYKQYILRLLFFKRLCDTWQEELETHFALCGSLPLTPDQHRIVIPPGASWHDVLQHPHHIGRALNHAFREIEAANHKLRRVLCDVNFDHPDRFPDATLRDLLAHFDRVSLRRHGTEPDVLGNAYLYLIAQFADDSGKKGGEFYTPAEVANLIVRCLEPQAGMSVYDPACGSGGLLLAAVRHLRALGEDPASLKLCGQEMNRDTWGLCMMNLIIHDIDASIARGDTLREPKHLDAEGRLQTFDRVLANPPFSLRNWGYEDWKKGDRFGRDRLGCPPRSYGDLAFVQHMVESLKPDGRLGVVLPHGSSLFRAGVEGEIRRGLLREDLIEAVINLPPKLFYGTKIPAVILFIRRQKPEARKMRVLLVDGSEEAVPGKNKNLLSEANLERLVGAFHDYCDVPRFSRVVPVEEILAQDGNLSIARYLSPTPPQQQTLDIKAEYRRWVKLKNYRDECERALFNELENLGYGS